MAVTHRLPNVVRKAGCCPKRAAAGLPSTGDDSPPGSGAAPKRAGPSSSGVPRRVGSPTRPSRTSHEW
jgi:hypothetical protein